MKPSLYKFSLFSLKKKEKREERREKRERKVDRTDTLSPQGNDEGIDVGELNEGLPSATPLSFHCPKVSLYPPGGV
jgi:hypothetical protein